MRVRTCLSSAVVGSSSPWMSLVVAIERVRTMQPFCLRDEATSDYFLLRFPQTAPTDEAEKFTNESHDAFALERKPTQYKEKNLSKGTGVVPAKYPPKVNSKSILTTLEC